MTGVRLPHRVPASGPPEPGRRAPALDTLSWPHHLDLLPSHPDPGSELPLGGGPWELKKHPRAGGTGCSQVGRALLMADHSFPSPAQTGFIEYLAPGTCHCVHTGGESRWNPAATQSQPRCIRGRRPASRSRCPAFVRSHPLSRCALSVRVCRPAAPPSFSTPLTVGEQDVSEARHVVPACKPISPTGPPPRPARVPEPEASGCVAGAWSLLAGTGLSGRGGRSSPAACVLVAGVWHCLGSFWVP